MNRTAYSLACVAVALAWLPSSPAGAATMRVLMVNQGNEAIFALRVGHASAAQWSGDLLAFDQVIDVSAGTDVAVDVDPLACVYDVIASYGDGHTEILRDVDLCQTQRVSFDH
jgi:hypothetical protein